MKSQDKVILTQVEQNIFSTRRNLEEVLAEIEGRIMIAGLVRIISHALFVLVIFLGGFVYYKGINGWPFYVLPFIFISALFLTVIFTRLRKSAAVRILIMVVCAKRDELIRKTEVKNKRTVDKSFIGALRRSLVLNIVQLLGLDVSEAAEHVMLFDNADASKGNMPLEFLGKAIPDWEKRRDEILQDINSVLQRL